MAYTISTWLAIYFVLWWVVLFVTLPFGVPASTRRAGRAGPIPARRSWRGWAANWSGPRSSRRVVFGIAMWAYNAGYLSIERLSKLMGMPF